MASVRTGSRAATGVRSPYPRSPVIEELTWAPPETIIRQAKGSDNWPMTWADDGHLYTAWGDGWGFEPFLPEKLSMGISRIEGTPPDLRGFNIRAPTAEDTGGGRAGRKASGMLMVDGVLYMWVRNADLSRLAWSTDHGRSWTWADWKFTEGFAAPTFLNFGKNYEHARDEYVYVYSQDAPSAYYPADRSVLARVPSDRISDRSAYEFLKEVGPGNVPVWSRKIEERGAVFSFPGLVYRSGISYNAPLKRYIWYQLLPDLPGETRYEGGFGVYDAPEPWGPWTTVYFTERWDSGPGDTGSFPTKWMSPDGRTMYLASAGDDYLSVRKATLRLGRQDAND